MEIKTQEISVPNQKWRLFTLVNNNGMEVSCLNYGGVITRILTPDRDGNFENVVLGFKNYEDYLANPNYFGALIGRVAGRVQDASFTLDGNTYELPASEGKNQLHGGPDGFHQVVWEVQPFEKEEEVGLVLSHFSKDGESGYPGNVEMKVTYTLDNSNQFSIRYQGNSDKKTALTTTNHTYFNLSGNLKNDILNHEVTLDSSEFVELDKQLIPTGNKLPVEGSVFDLRQGRQIKEGAASEEQQNVYAKSGYDHYFIFDRKKNDNATVQDNSSGRQLIVQTEQPGVVMYTSNGLGDQYELTEGRSKKYLGICLETQASPASLHHEGFPSVILDKDETYDYKTTFRFGLMAD